jgi:hypothetical protein
LASKAAWYAAQHDADAVMAAASCMKLLHSIRPASESRQYSCCCAAAATARRAVSTRRMRGSCLGDVEDDDAMGTTTIDRIRSSWCSGRLEGWGTRLKLGRDVCFYRGESLRSSESQGGNKEEEGRRRCVVQRVDGQV